jgi:hypothetical protein
MTPDDTTMYINVTRQSFISFTWDAFEDFLRVYAGLLVDGSMIAEFACRGLKQKQQ